MSSPEQPIWEQSTRPSIDRPRVPLLSLDPMPQARLVGLAGECVGVVHELKANTVLGRRIDVDITLPDTEISRRHAQILLGADGARLLDLGSHNGTYLNGQAVRDAPLQDGDVVRLGSTTALKFVLRSSEADGDRPELLPQELHAAQERLVQTEKFAAVGRMAAAVGHEIINPLSLVMHNLAFLANELSGLPEPQGEQRIEMENAVRDAQDGAERVRAIVSDLQDFSRQFHELREPVSLSSVVEQAHRSTAHRTSKRVGVELTLCDGLWVRANPLRLEQVLVNLLINAADAMLEGKVDNGVIHVTTRREGQGRAAVDVVDRGVGIPQANLKRIFEPYFTTKPKGHGTGLGLAICQAIVTALGGEIRVQSLPGQGSTFSVVLPTCELPPEIGKEAPAGRASSARSVLVLDDPTTVEAIGRAVGREVESCASIDELVARINRGNRFDILFCAADASGHPASEVFRQLSAIDPAQAQRMVFLLPGKETRLSDAVLATCPNPRMPKPLEPARLGQLIEAWLALWAD